MKKTFLVLANSIRRGCRCIGGREMFQKDGKWFYGPWIRPVSQQGEGEVRTQESTCADGTQPAVLDVVEVTLTAKQDCAHQPENYLIASSCRWQKNGTIPANSLGAIEEKPAHLWLQPGGRTDRIHSQMAVASLNPFQSLYLVRPVNLRFRIWEAMDDFRGGPRKQQRSVLHICRNGIQPSDHRPHHGNALLSSISGSEPAAEGDCADITGQLLSCRRVLQPHSRTAIITR